MLDNYGKEIKNGDYIYNEYDEEKIYLISERDGKLFFPDGVELIEKFNTKDFWEIVQISQDGNQVCALIGNDLQEGYAGFGDTTEEAIEDLVKYLNTQA